MSVDSPPAEPAAPDERVVAKGFLPPALREAAVPAYHYDADYSVYLNRFPLGGMENFSVARAAYAKAQSGGHLTAKVWRDEAPWERAYIEATTELATKANLGDAISGVDGAYLAPEFWSQQWFGLLRNHTALDQLPVTRLVVPARVTHLPRVTGDLTIYYPGENVAATVSAFKFGQISFTAHKATAAITVSNELIRDAANLADQVLRNQSAEAIAVDRDTQLLTGTGGPNPTGLLNMPQMAFQYSATTATINTTPHAAQPGYKNIGELIQVVENLNGSTLVPAGQSRCSGMIAHSQFKQTVWSSANFADAQGRPMWFSDLNADGGLFGQKWSLTNILPTNRTVGGTGNCSVIIAGMWERYVLMEVDTLSYDATPAGNAFLSDETQIKITHRYDGAPANIEAFTILDGVLV